ncbi:MAG: NRDE family protein [Pseudomonadota bacterium]
MCLLLIDWCTHPEFLLVVAANRDEFHDRPAAPADWWTELSDIFGGRDLEAGGTWMAINRRGHFAAVTNVRKPGGIGAKTRGELSINFLVGNEADPKERLLSTANEYNGYNFIGYGGEALHWFNNVEATGDSLVKGVYGLSNASLDTPWPKLIRLKSSYQVIAQQNDNFSEALFDLLADRHTPPDDDLPNTGVGLQMERQLSPIFIEGDTYGTRCCSVYTLSRTGVARFVERRFDRDRTFIGESAVEFEITDTCA